MTKLTEKEEEVMEYIWSIGKCTPKEVQDVFPEPKPHINTIATVFQILEKKGYLVHATAGRGYVYSPIIDKSKYRSSRLGNLVDRLFGKSYLSVVSSLVKEEKVTEEELLELINELKKGR